MYKMKSFGTDLQEQVDEKKYKLVILSHDDPHDPNVTGPLIRKKASELGIEVFLAEFNGMYMEDKGKDQLVYSFPVDESIRGYNNGTVNRRANGRPFFNCGSRNRYRSMD